MEVSSAPERYFPTPPGSTVHKSLLSLFQHYCKPVTSAIAPDDSARDLTMDGATFHRMCRDCPPELGQRLGRTTVDLVFSKTKPVGTRRLDYEHFLDALLGLAKAVYPDEEPTLALATFISINIFALFDQPASIEPQITLQQVYDELCS